MYLSLKHKQIGKAKLSSMVQTCKFSKAFGLHKTGHPPKKAFLIFAGLLVQSQKDCVLDAVGQ
jgi:hypothetical protein